MKMETPAARRASLLRGALLGGVTSVPVMALAFLAAQWFGVPFFPFDIFDWLARILPGSLITLGIDSMVRVITSLRLASISESGKRAEQSMALLIVLGAGIVFGLLLAFIARHRRWSGSSIGIVLGLLGFLFVAGIELSLAAEPVSELLIGLVWLGLLLVAWGALLGRWIAGPAAPAGARAPAPAAAYEPSRREALKVIAGSIGVAVVASGLGALVNLQKQTSGAGAPLAHAPTPNPPSGNNPAAAPTLGPTPPASETAQATLRDRVPPVPGTRAELTPNASFYRIDIDTEAPVIREQAWQLQVSGLFDRPRSLTLADLMAFPAVTQTITQGCISNPVGGDLISTTNYTGLRVRDLLAELGLRPEAHALEIRSADGFYESVEMRDLMDPRTLLVYGMNGVALPVEHGFPLRIYIPNRYGMKQPKWITSIEAIARNGPGYWVDRGWSATAFPQIVSVVDAVAKDQAANGRVPVGGIAWAGDRGIQKVEVQVDNEPWTEAVLRTPPLSPLTWVEWRYDWPAVPGRHTFRVRATDGTGALQVEAPEPTYPNGATGYHSLTETI